MLSQIHKPDGLPPDGVATMHCDERRCRSPKAVAVQPHGSRALLVRAQQDVSRMKLPRCGHAFHQLGNRRKREREGHGAYAYAWVRKHILGLGVAYLAAKNVLVPVLLLGLAVLACLGLLLCCWIASSVPSDLEANSIFRRRRAPGAKQG